MQKVIFDKEQERAVRHSEGPLLLLAGPGSGKTTVLTNRVLRLHQEEHVPERNILVLTFTKMAAAEMKERYRKLKGAERTEVTFGTFHSVFFRFLLEEGNCSGFTLEEPEAVESTIDRILRELKGESFHPGNLSAVIAGNIGRIKNGFRVDDPLTQAVYSRLKSEMKTEKRMDFDDILLSCFQLLTDDPAFLEKLRNRYRYILIDEFQDINRIQYEIIRLLAAPQYNVFAVGDDDQSIYGFRGSDPEYMRRFLKDFPKAKKQLLPVNHRSTGRIVKASGKLIRRNRKRFPKKLHSSSGKGITPYLMEFASEREEADYIEQTVRRYQRIWAQEELQAPTFAVLGRTRLVLKSLSDCLSAELLSQVKLLTFHASKGLEFDVVFIIGANEGITPGSRSISRNELEEERRCFYVAMTRAKRVLHILNTSTLYDKTMQCSRFVKELKTLF